MRPRLPYLTVNEVVALAKRKGSITVNPLKYRKWRGVNACFEAAHRGLLRKERVNCGHYVFYPIP